MLIFSGNLNNHSFQQQTTQDLSPPSGHMPRLTCQNTQFAFEILGVIFQMMIFFYRVIPVLLQNCKLHKDDDNVHFIYIYIYIHIHTHTSMNTCLSTNM